MANISPQNCVLGSARGLEVSSLETAEIMVRWLMGAISVEVKGKSIVITKPGTDCAVTYQKDPDAPHLIMTHTWLPASVTSPAAAAFRAQAVRAALSKARELGWIS